MTVSVWLCAFTSQAPARAVNDNRAGFKGLLAPGSASPDGSESLLKSPVLADAPPAVRDCGQRRREPGGNTGRSAGPGGAEEARGRRGGGRQGRVRAGLARQGAVSDHSRMSPVSMSAEGRSSSQPNGRKPARRGDIPLTARACSAVLFLFHAHQTAGRSWTLLTAREQFGFEPSCQDKRPCPIYAPFMPLSPSALRDARS